MSTTGDSPDNNRPPRPDRPAHPPVTIDLEAVREDAAKDASSSPGGASAGGQRPATPVSIWAVGFGGAASGLLLAFLLQWSGLIGTGGGDAAALAALRRDIDQVKGDLAQAAAATAPLAEKTEARLADIDRRMAALTTRLAQPPVPDPALVGQLQDLARRLATLEAAPRANPAEIADLQRRLDLLQRRVDPPSVAARVELPAAIDALRAAATRGRPFAEEAALVRSLGGEAATIDAIAPFAAKGVPARDKLVDDFPPVADAILRASAPAAPDGGVLGRLSERARSLVTVRPAAPMAGDSPEAVVSRMLARAREGDLAGIIAEGRALPEAGRNAAQGWVLTATARLELDRALARLALQGRAP